MEIDIENHINVVKDRLNRIQRDIENQQQDPRNSTITEITIASSDDNPLDNSELNPLTLSMLQSPINRSSSNSSLDIQNLKDNSSKAISTPKLKSTDKFSLITTNNAKNHKIDNLTDSDSYSDSELNRLVASNKFKIKNINQRLEFISNDQESSDISSPTAQTNLSPSNTSNSSDSSSFEDNIQNRFRIQNNSNEQTPKQREIEATQNLIMTISDDSSDDSDENENNEQQSNLDQQTFRKREIERAKKLIMDISDSSSEDSDVNIQTKKRLFSSSDSDIEKIQIEIDAQKAEMEKIVTKDAEMLPESEKVETMIENAKDNTLSFENMNKDELKINIDDISTSDSDDMPQFIPPVPDEIELNLDFSKFSKNSIVYNPNISTPETLEALDKTNLSSNKETDDINYILNVDDISSEELDIPQIDDDSNDEAIMKRIIDHSTDDDDILRIIKDSNENDLPKFTHLPKTKNENDNIVQIMGNPSDLNILKHDNKLKNEMKNIGLHEQQSNSSLELMNALMSGSEIDSDISLHDELADSDESDVSFKKIISAIDLNH